MGQTKPEYSAELLRLNPPQDIDIILQVGLTHGTLPELCDWD